RPGAALHAARAPGHHRREQLERAPPRLGREAAEGQRLHLPLQRLHVVRVAMTDAADRDAGDEVDVLVAVLVDERRALSPRHREAGVQRERLKAGSDVAALARHDLLRARADLAPAAPPLARSKRSAGWAARARAASSRYRAKLGHALRSSSTGSPAAVAIASPPQISSPTAAAARRARPPSRVAPNGCPAIIWSLW